MFYVYVRIAKQTNLAHKSTQASLVAYANAIGPVDRNGGEFSLELKSNVPFCGQKLSC